MAFQVQHLNPYCGLRGALFVDGPGSPRVWQERCPHSPGPSPAVPRLQSCPTARALPSAQTAAPGSASAPRRAPGKPGTGVGKSVLSRALRILCRAGPAAAGTAGRSGAALLGFSSSSNTPVLAPRKTWRCCTVSREERRSWAMVWRKGGSGGPFSLSPTPDRRRDPRGRVGLCSRGTRTG